MVVSLACWTSSTVVSNGWLEDSALFSRFFNHSLTWDVLGISGISGISEVEKRGIDAAKMRLFVETPGPKNVVYWCILMYIDVYCSIMVMISHDLSLSLRRSFSRENRRLAMDPACFPKFPMRLRIWFQCSPCEDGSQTSKLRWIWNINANQWFASHFMSFHDVSWSFLIDLIILYLYVIKGKPITKPIRQKASLWPQRGWLSPWRSSSGFASLGWCHPVASCSNKDNVSILRGLKTKTKGEHLPNSKSRIMLKGSRR